MTGRRWGRSEYLMSHGNESAKLEKVRKRAYGRENFQKIVRCKGDVNGYKTVHTVSSTEYKLELN